MDPLYNAVHGATASVGITGVSDSSPIASDVRLFVLFEIHVVCLQKAANNFCRRVLH